MGRAEHPSQRAIPPGTLFAPDAHYLTSTARCVACTWSGPSYFWPPGAWHAVAFGEGRQAITPVAIRHHICPACCQEVIHDDD